MAWTVIPGAGGVAWPAPLPAALAIVDITPYDSIGVEDQRAGGLPQVAVDPTTDVVYIVWEDNRFRTDNGASASQQNDAVIISSPPGTSGIPGLTPGAWSAPKVINPGPENNHVDRWNTTVAVGADSIVRVAYRQRDETPAMYSALHTHIDTYYQESRDAGATFSAPLLANTSVTSEPGYGAFDTTNCTACNFEGDYNQIAAGGSDESFVSRDEAYAPTAGATCPCSFSGPPSANQWQQTWVAYIAPQPSTVTPDTKFVPVIALIGIVIAALAVRRRRAALTR